MPTNKPRDLRPFCQRLHWFAPVSRAVGRLVGVALVALVLWGGWLVPDTYAGSVPTSRHGVGACQRFVDVQEFYTLSDVSPPVPCDQPHQTEVYQVGTYTGTLAGLGWPGLEAINKARSTLCHDQRDVLAYLGARPQDAIWGFQIIVRMPTPGEWDKGDRTYRCELMQASPAAGRPPEFRRPMAGILRTPDAPKWRHCAAGEMSVTCDREHTGEYVNAWLPIKGDIDLHEWARQACGPYVEAYLGTPPGERGGHVDAIEVDGPGTRTGACVAVTGKRTTGSLVTVVTR